MHPKKLLFIDTEFTSLSQKGSLISLAMVGDEGFEFYAEFTDYAQNNVSDFVKKEVEPNLILKGLKETTNPDLEIGSVLHLKGTTRVISNAFQQWLSLVSKEENSIQVWGNCLSYDWVLFCEIFGGSMSRPEQIHYMPMDISLLFQIKTGDPDKGMEEFIDDEDLLKEKKLHNALYDAKLTKACYHKLNRM